MTSLEQVLADYRGEAAVLRRAGHTRDADLIERFSDDVADTTEEYRTWLSEADAKLYSGHGPEWLRARFGFWERQGHARWDGRRRQFRQIVLPRRANPEAAKEAGRMAGAGATESAA